MREHGRGTIDINIRISYLCLVAMLLQSTHCNVFTSLLSSHAGQTAIKDELKSNASFAETLTQLCKLRQCDCPLSDTAPPKRIDCSYRHISTLHRLSVPVNVTEINLSGNNFSEIYDYFFYVGEGVHVLDISHNAITFIAMSSFHGFKNLDKLVLAHNRLYSLEEDVFRGLERLRTLDLSFNRISTVFPRDFNYLTALDYLDLSHNPLMKISGSVFNGLKTLNKLSLQSTGLNSLSATALCGLSNLKWLALGGNAFTVVPLEAMRTLTQLRHLDLSRNPFKILPPFSFANLTSLRSVKLRYMTSLRSIEHHAFGDAVYLKSVDLSFSPHLQRIDKLAFAFSKSDARIDLDEFYVRQATLQALPADLLRWNSVLEVDFAENPWKCDCRLSWMQNVVKRDVIDGKLRCASPSSLEGRLIAKLNPEEMLCTDTLSLGSRSPDISTAMKVTFGLLIAVSIVLFSVILAIVVSRLRARKARMYRSLKERFSYSGSGASDDK